jgi:penicillin amidase
VRRLLAWDGVMDKEQVAPALYAATREQLVRLVTERPVLRALGASPFQGEPAALGGAARAWAAVSAALAEDDTSLLAEGERWDDLLVQALQRAVAMLRETLGEEMDTWRWERLHTTRPIHPLSGAFPEQAEALNPPAVAIGGDGDTVQAAATFPGQSFHVNGTSVARYAFDLADWDNSRWVVPLGASGHPASPHYADQAADWSALRTHPMTYSWDKVAAEAETTQRLEPA